MEKEETPFFNDIRKFNGMYNFPVNRKPTLLGIERLRNFKNILSEELDEVDDIIQKYEEAQGNLTKEKQVEILTALSDWLGDIVVFATSEATKHGLDLNKTLEIIMQSNFSKLGEDGSPIHDERGKLLKGPNFFPPEPRIQEFLKEELSE